MPVSIDFQSMEDFQPAKVASKVEPLQKLIDARQQLSSLLTYMDGKTGAEDLLAKVMQDPDLLKTIAQVPNQDPKS
jgi:type VI secretion system protein ImpB